MSAAAHPGTGWSEVFPELGTPGRWASWTVPDLLARVDAVPSDLPSARPSSLGRDARTTTRGTGPRVAPPAAGFGPVLVGAVAPRVREWSERVGALPLLADAGAVDELLWQESLVTATEQLTRCLVGVLGEESRRGRLRGTDPEDRYGDFVSRFVSGGGYRDLDRRHPDLLPRLEALLDVRLGAIHSQLVTTAVEWDRITQALGLPASSRLVDVVAGGDRHGGGHSVLVMSTDSGARLVMKPRSTVLESGYTGFSAWLGRVAARQDLSVPAFHSTPAAGWMSYVERGTRLHPDFFAQTGVHLAALQLLRGTDVHYENLLVDRTGRPVVVDAEALFRPELAGTARTSDPAALLDVRATGLLSQTFGGAPASGNGDAGRGDAFDVGALDFRSGTRSPFRGWQLVDAGRDDMRLVMRPVDVDHPGVVPADTPRGPAQAEALVGAYERTMAYALRDPEAVCAEVTRRFSGGRCRYIHRPTMSYALLLRMATHPRFAADVDRRRVFGRLAVTAPETDWTLVAAEVRQLTAGDVPAFTVDLDDTRVRDARGRDTGARTSLPPMAGVLGALRRLDEGVLARQSTLLAGALRHWHRRPATDRPPDPTRRHAAPTT